MKLLRNYFFLFFIFFLQKYQDGLEESMRGSVFLYDGVDALYYNLNKISLSRGGSYKKYQRLDLLLINTIGKI